MEIEEGRIYSREKYYRPNEGFLFLLKIINRGMSFVTVGVIKSECEGLKELGARYSLEINYFKDNYILVEKSIEKI